MDELSPLASIHISHSLQTLFDIGSIIACSLFAVITNMLHRRIVLSFLNLLYYCSRIFAQCYHPNGDLVTSTDYQPCNSALGLASMCCATNRTQNADICLPSGLCQNYAENNANNGIITLLWRESCTDQHWQSNFCLKLCITGAGKVHGREFPDAN